MKINLLYRLIFERNTRKVVFCLFMINLFRKSNFSQQVFHRFLFHIKMKEITFYDEFHLKKSKKKNKQKKMKVIVQTLQPPIMLN